jgi:TRAP-type C4-dicarboxylate transport system permease small subunit
MAKRILKFVSDLLSTWLEVIAGVALVALMLLTGCDIVGRTMGHPIPGTYEIVSFAGGLVIGLAMPVTSRVRAHVMMDILVANVSARAAVVFHFVTRIMGIALFLLLGYASIKMGFNLRDSGEVTPTLSLPFYMVTFAIAGACFIECVILANDMVEKGGEGND